MVRAFLLYLSDREAPRHFLAGNKLGRRLARRFIAGEGWQDALGVVGRLNAGGFDASLDYLGESVREPAAAEDACRAYLSLLDRVEAEGLRSHVSVKLTQLGLAIDEGLAQRNLQALCARAAEHDNFVRIDMEGSDFTEATLRVFRAVNAPRDVLGVVVQSYLRRAGQDVSELIKIGARVRLVKGAYKEPAEIAFQRKADVDKNFKKLAEMLLASGGYHAIATHDPRLIAHAREFARARNLSPEQFEFQFLYGVRRSLQRNLLRQGYRVRVYIPFGKQWYPYFMRRLAERPANVLFLLRNLFRR